MLTIKFLVLVVLVVLAVRYRRARIPLVVVAIVLLLQHLHCRMDAPIHRDDSSNAPTGPQEFAPDMGSDTLLHGGPIDPNDCPDHNNCTPPVAPVDAAP